ncbi:hypothetical protein Taro_026955 [Colocasia esculenta]|uniref:Uncharacterized protein n=1 Tax=Colocasia esculenta TaxID=4460 RepID=A0A843VQ72_COLES|nr:hypothetical protein [Colocasia esculenta]
MSSRPQHLKAALQAQLEAQQAQAQVPVPQTQDHGGPSIMERFKRMSPPSFKGERDPLLAESWLREIEKIFRTIRCADDDRVTLVTYMLQDQGLPQTSAGSAVWSGTNSPSSNSSNTSDRPTRETSSPSSSVYVIS